MKISFEYGHGEMQANLPDNTDVFVAGETVPDPPNIPEDQVSKKTLESIRNPIGMEPLTELANKNSKVSIIFPDKVKGGEHETAHRKISIKLSLQEIYSVDVKKKNIIFICSNGLHRKNTKEEIKNILGDDLFNEFWHSNQIVNHDSEDYENIVDLGSTERGDPVFINKHVYDSDIAILVGHTLGNPYGGYSGGYKHCSKGINHGKSIAANNVLKVMHSQNYITATTKSLMRNKFDEIGMHMEKGMGKKFFCIDAILNTKSQQIAVYSGYAKEMQPASRKEANKRTFVPFAKEKYDVLVFGLPQSFHYCDGMGTNPIMLMQAISAQVTRHRRILSDKCVILCSSTCNGFFHDEIWPYTREMYNMFQNEYMNT